VQKLEFEEAQVLQDATQNWHIPPLAVLLLTVPLGQEDTHKDPRRNCPEGHDKQMLSDEQVAQEELHAKHVILFE